MNEIETSTLGRCYRKIDNYALYKDATGFLSVYLTWKEDDVFHDGKEYAVWRGYLAHLENFEAVVEDLKYEDKIALAELRAEMVND